MRRLTKEDHHKINPLWRIYSLVRFPQSIYQYIAY